MTPSIFVQIASYRDPQLIPTIEDALAKASGQYSLIFGICNQYDLSTKDFPFRGSNFRVDAIPYPESRGVCWARNRIQALYDGEDYTLQLDSHHRFVPGWDAQLVSMLSTVDSAKPLLTTYLPPFTPEGPVFSEPVPATLRFATFRSAGEILFRSDLLHKWRLLTAPIPGRFFSAHFCFTLGTFAAEVPHDPNLYFIGEEINLAVRAYTHGYDIFHPHRAVAWHAYTRCGRPKHWQDHPWGDGLYDWRELDNISRWHNSSILGIGAERSDIEPSHYGLGKARTLHDYERYAGISFTRRAVQPATIANTPPTGADFAVADDDWLGSLQADPSLDGGPHHFIRLTGAGLDGGSPSRIVRF